VEKYLLKSLVLFLVLISVASALACIWQIDCVKSRATQDALIVANRITKTPNNLHTAQLLLQYSFQGRFFREWQTAGKPHPKRSHIEAFLGERAPGSHLQISVDPANPTQLISTATGWQAYQAAILFGILSLAAAIAAQVVYLS
jgi:hypothetical protein